jgi:hypothetical protein
VEFQTLPGIFQNTSDLEKLGLHHCTVWLTFMELSLIGSYNSFFTLALTMSHMHWALYMNHSF